jgi:TetR/AcrR family transcriptional repressor of nem operon
MPRTPEYKRSTVIAQAMAVFWERGYARTSVGHLTRATGLNPGSLYAAFGSKKGVFLEVLDEYNRDFLERIHAMSRSDANALAALRGLLDDIVEDTIAGEDRRGCLSVNALLELARHEPDIARRIDAHNASVRRALAELIGRGQRDGDIDADADPDALSAFLVNNIWGMRIMCRSRPDPAALEAVVDNVVKALERR